MGLAYQELREISRLAGRMCFKVTPKVHKVQHLPLYSSCLNPRHVQNYAEESLIGTSTKIWARSVSGRHTQSVQPNVLVKKITGLLLRMEA